MAQMKVFVSHSHEDDDFCRALVAEVRGAGVDVWYDEHNLGTGELSDTIDRELRARPGFVLILTPAALRSTAVRDQCELAYNLLRRDPPRLILPVTPAPGVEEDALPPYLREFTRVEAPGLMPYPSEEAIRRTLYACAAALGGKYWTQLLDTREAGRSLGKGIFFADMGRSDESAAAYNRALAAHDRLIAFDPNAVAAQDNKARSLNLMGRHQDALDTAERALALDGQYVGAWVTKGQALRGLKRYDEAVEAYDRALALDPKLAPAWEVKALSLRALGRVAEAEQAERRAKELGG